MTKLSEALEELEESRNDHAESLKDFATLLTAVRTQHVEDGHRDNFRWCLRPGCKAAAALESDYAS